MDSNGRHDGLDAARTLMIAGTVVCALLGGAVMVDVLARSRLPPAAATQLVGLLGLGQLSVVEAGSPLRHPELGNAGVDLRSTPLLDFSVVESGALLVQPLRTGGSN